MRKVAWMFGAAMAACLAAPVAANEITSLDGADLARLLEAAGLPATVSVDGAGDPLVGSRAADANFFVSMYDCDAGRCGSIQFRAGFDVSGSATTDMANEWNRTMRYAEAWIDDVGDPWLEMDADIAGGVSEAQVTEYIETWSSLLALFQAHIGD